jgi:hypothetical protein
MLNKERKDSQPKRLDSETDPLELNLIENLQKVRYAVGLAVTKHNDSKEIKHKFEDIDIEKIKIEYIKEKQAYLITNITSYLGSLILPELTLFFHFEALDVKIEEGILNDEYEPKISENPNLDQTALAFRVKRSKPVKTTS